MAQHNQTALVTGASTAAALAKAGAHVLVHYGRSAQEAESLVKRKVEAQMQSRRIWELRTALRC